MLAKRKVRSARPITAMQAWWLTHQIPIVTNETTYVLGPGVHERRAERTAGGVGGDVDDQECRGDREDGVGEEFQPGGLHDSRRD